MSSQDPSKTKQEWWYLPATMHDNTSYWCQKSSRWVLVAHQSGYLTHEMSASIKQRTWFQMRKHLKWCAKVIYLIIIQEVGGLTACGSWTPCKRYRVVLAQLGNIVVGWTRRRASHLSNRLHVTLSELVATSLKAALFGEQFFFKKKFLILSISSVPPTRTILAKTCRRWIKNENIKWK